MVAIDNRPLRFGRMAMISLPLTFLLLFYFYPLLSILQLSFSGESASGEQLLAVLTSPVFREVLWFTCWQAGLSTLLTLILGLPAAYVFTHYSFTGKRLVLALMTIPFVLPTVVTASAFRALLGRNGLINELFLLLPGTGSPLLTVDQSFWLFLLAHVFYNFALVVRVISSYWSTLDPQLPAAARMLGASPWQAFLRTTLPQLAPAVWSVAILVFIFCFTSFGIILILGGPGYATLEVEIYRQAVQLFNLPVAASLSLVQICVNFLLMWFHARVSGKSGVSFFTGPYQNVAVKAVDSWQRLAVGITLALSCMLLFAPLAALALRSVRGANGWTLIFYTSLFEQAGRSVFFVSPFAAITNSLLFASGAMLLSLLLGLLAAMAVARQQRSTASLLDATFMLPLATSAVTLGFGFIISLNHPPIDLRSSLWLVVIAHTLVAFPFVIRSLLPAIRQIPRNLKEAAAMLGASPRQTWQHIDLPIITRALLVAAVFAFSISMGEFGASAFVARPHTPTLPLAIFRALSQPGDLNYGQAMAMSTILMAVTLVAFRLIQRLEKRDKP